MIVRLALQTDIEAIIELARGNCALSTPHLTFSADKVRETCQSYLTTAHPTMFVAEKDGIVIGLLVATLNEYRHAEGLYTTQEVIYVDEAHRGGRAATLLMKQLIAWSEEIGAIEITGGNDNGFQSERTAAFLEHFGFERVGFFMRREV